jgi:soluble lytic murein transglycosylase
MDDYKTFLSGKSYYEGKEYNKAEQEFLNLLENYPDSKVLSSHYAYYYIGMTYFELGKYNEAIKNLKLAEYVPLEYKMPSSYFKNYKKSLFEYDIYYYIGLSYLQLKEEKVAEDWLKKLIKDYFSIELIPFEKAALEKLKKIDQYYSYIEDIKYKNDLSRLEKINKEDLVPLGDSFFSKGEYPKAAIVYQRFLEFENSKEVKLKILNSFTRAKDYDSVVELSNKYYLEDGSHDNLYFLANAVRRKGDVRGAIESLSKVTNGNYYLSSKFLEARMYSILGEADKSIEILKKINSSSAHEELLDTYLKNNMLMAFKMEAVEFIKKYPYSEYSAFLRFKMYELSNNKNYLNWILKYNKNSYYFERASNILGTSSTSKDYPILWKKSVYKDQINKLEDVYNLKDPELVKIELDTLSIPKEEAILRNYIFTDYLKKLDLYHFSLRTAYNNIYESQNYNNLNELLYPRFYRDIVEKYSSIYGVSPALAYSVMRQESLFNKDVVSSASAYGLMQIILPTAKQFNPEITVEELLTPEKNIEIGIKYLSELVNIFDGKVDLVAAAYNGGPSNVKKWKKDIKGHLDIDSIPFDETRNYVKKVLNNYEKYKRFYGE